MKILTLIPNADTYGVMCLIMLSLGSFTIARHIHIRWLKDKFSFVGSNAIVKSAIAFLGLLIIPWQDFFPQNVSKLIFVLLIGIILGFITIYCETKMIRKINRKKITEKSYSHNQSGDGYLRNSTVTTKMSLSSKKNISAKGLSHIRKSYSQYAEEPDFLNYSLLAVIVVAIAEEFLFRGYIVSIAEIMKNQIIGISIILCEIALFAVSHISSSWKEFQNKLTLSCLATLGIVMTGNLITSIATHVTLNIYAFMQLRKIRVKTSAENILPVGIC